MGVSLEVYRCRIGSFHGGHCLVLLMSCNRDCAFEGSGLRALLLAAVVLSVLLLIGGVEQNPGPPQHTCKVCMKAVSTPSAYFNHMRLHPRYRGGGNTIPCSVSSCLAKISSVSSFKSHYSLYHVEKETTASASSSSNSTSIAVNCPFETCPHTMKDRADYTAHMGVHLKNGLSFKCFLTNCPGTLMHNTNQFYTHNSRYHSNTTKEPLPDQVTGDVSLCVSAVDPNLLSEHPGDVDMDDDLDNDNMIGQQHGDSQDDDCEDDEQDLFPIHAIKDELAQFYLTLEAVELLPSTTVQIVAEEIKFVSEMIHRVLRKNLRSELETENIEPDSINRIIRDTFSSEPIFNIHHWGKDTQQLGTEFLRMSYFQKQFQFVKPEEIPLGYSVSGKKRCAQWVSVRLSLEAMLRDENIMAAVLQSLEQPITDTPDVPSPDFIFQDFTDGTVFRDHVKCEEHRGKKCIRLFLFQDAFDPNAYGKGNYKPTGFYFSLANLPPKTRSQLEKIQLAFMVLEQDLKNSTADELEDIDRLSKALQPLVDDLIDLKTNGVEVNGETLPVCLIFLIGDSLGQNQMGRFVTNFASSSFSCRFCTMSKEDFKEKPEVTGNGRTPEEYNRHLRRAKTYYSRQKAKALQVAKQKAEKAAAKCTAPSKKKVTSNAISKSALRKLTSIHVRGVKYRPSPFNRPELQFHVVNHQPPCLAHDLFEGIVKVVVPLILQHFSEVKKWFDLETLNRRIMAFKPKGSDANDKPKPLKTFEKLRGNAVENWNFVRLLPFMIGDLIQDPEDDHWQMFLLLKQLIEYVCAPRITFGQIGFLRTLITEFILLVKTHLPSCLIPKLHYLCHYPGLIIMFGPLIRLFTLRFESKHSFFKRVIKSCRSHINVTATMAKKYMYRFAYDAMVGCKNEMELGTLSDLNSQGMNEEMRELLDSTQQIQEMEKVTVSGTDYNINSYLLLDDLEGMEIKVGCIQKIVIGRCGSVSFVVEEMKAEKSDLGFYIVSRSMKSLSMIPVGNLPDYFPLVAYKFQGKDCISLKHSVPFIY